MRVIIVFSNNLSHVWYAQVTDATLSNDIDLVRELIRKSICLANTIPPVIWVKGNGKNEGIIAAYDVQLLDKVELERHRLPRHQIPQPYRHILFLLLALSHDSGFTISNCIIVFFLCFVLFHDFG